MEKDGEGRCDFCFGMSRDVYMCKCCVCSRRACLRCIKRGLMSQRWHGIKCFECTGTPSSREGYSALRDDDDDS